MAWFGFKFGDGLGVFLVTSMVEYTPFCFFLFEKEYCKNVTFIHHILFGAKQPLN